MWLLIYCCVCGAHKLGRMRACGGTLECPVNNPHSPEASAAAQFQTPRSQCSIGGGFSLQAINLSKVPLAQNHYPLTSMYLCLPWCMSCRPPPGCSLRDTHTCSCPWCWHRSESTVSHCLWHTHRYLQRSKSSKCPKAGCFRPQIK